MTAVYDEWAAGWRAAEADDNNHIAPHPHPTWPPDSERGYRDYWTSPGGHEKRLLDHDYQTYAGAALLPDPPIGSKDPAL